MTSQNLEPVSVTLAYRLGELTFFRRELQGFADRTHFTRQAMSPGCPGIPAGSPPSDFYFFPCYPVEGRPPVRYRQGEWLYYTPYVFKNYFIDFARYGSFAEYLEAFSGKSRSTLRRKVRKFAEASGGQIDWRVARSPSEMEEFLRLAQPVSARTYQARLLGAGLPTSAEFAGQLRDAAGSGDAFGYLLFLDGAAVAYVLCLCRGGIATYDYVGFDPAVQALSPGTVLQYLLLESMFADRRVTIFDFTEGEGAQKEFFATDHRVCAKTYVLRATWGNVAAVTGHLWTDRISSALGDILEKLQVKRAVKRLLRRSI